MNPETFLDSFGHLADAPGGVDRLRRLILELAMRGRLTERQSGDEPASELLARARLEKARLVESGAVRKPKSYAELTDEDLPFDVPQGWEWCRTVDLIHTVNGRAFKPTEWSGSGLPIIRIQNLNNLSAPFNHFAGEVSDAHLVAPGDLLISWSGTPGTSFGAFVWSGPAGALNQHIFKCRLFDDYRDFICLAVNSRLDVLIGDARGGVGLQHFTKDKLERLPLAIPPLQEQQRIVERVSELMTLCDELEEQQAARVEARSALTAATLHRITDADAVDDLRAAIDAFADNIGLHFAPGDGDLAALKRIRQSILDLAVRGRLTHQDPADEPATELLARVAAERDRLVKAKEIRKPKQVRAVEPADAEFSVPEGWAWCRLGNLLVSNEAGWSPVCPQEPRSHDEQWGVLKLSAVSWGRFRGDEHKVLAPGLRPRPAIEVRDGDFLMSRANTAALVGRSVVVDSPPPRLMMSDLIVRLGFVHRVSAEYINLLNGSSSVRSLYATASKGTSDTMRKLSREQILATPVPLPPLAEQGRIVDRVTELNEMCDRLEQQLLAARSLRGDLAASIAAHLVPTAPERAA